MRQVIENGAEIALEWTISVALRDDDDDDDDEENSDELLIQQLYNRVRFANGANALPNKHSNRLPIHGVFSSRF